MQIKNKFLWFQILALGQVFIETRLVPIIRHKMKSDWTNKQTFFDWIAIQSKSNKLQTSFLVFEPSLRWKKTLWYTLCMEMSSTHPNSLTYRSPIEHLIATDQLTFSHSIPFSITYLLCSFFFKAPPTSDKRIRKLISHSYSRISFRTREFISARSTDMKKRVATTESVSRVFTRFSMKLLEYPRFSRVW